MHRIIKSHLEGFVKSNGFEQLDESVQFEMFVNYSILSSKMVGPIEVENITTSEGDDGTDGIAILINEELIISDGDALSVFKSERKNQDVEVIFIQSKRSESYDLGDFLKFKESINRFLTAEHYEVVDDTQKTAREIFDVIINNVRVQFYFVRLKIKKRDDLFVILYCNTKNIWTQSSLAQK